MKTICTTVYTFAELSDDAKDKAVQALWDLNVDSEFWHEGITSDCFPAICDILGIDLDTRGKQKCVWFSGFSSQGDGACFEGSYRYNAGALKRLLKEYPQETELHAIARNLQTAQKSNFYQLRAGIRQAGRCYSISVNVERYDDKELTANAEDDVTECMNDLCSYLYKWLETEYDYQTSRAQVIEGIEANEYNFTEQGELV